MSREPRVLPLFPLPGVVHFPRTELPLHIFEPRYRQLVRDLLVLPASQRLIGMVLSIDSEEGDLPGLRILGPGTAGRLIRCEELPDGRFYIALYGEFRFTLRDEVDGRPYYQATVEPLDDEEGEGLGRELWEQVARDAAPLAAEYGDDFPLDARELGALARRERQGELINRLAAGLDLPIARRHLLLAMSFGERARAVASILDSRRRFCEALRPFRHLAGAAGRN